MGSWKKIITSGSSAELNQISASALHLPNIGDVSSSISSIITNGNIDVEGSITTQDATNAVIIDKADGISLKGDGAGSRSLKTTTSDALLFGTNNTERARIKSDGNVGIGNNDPQQKLHVNGNIRVHEKDDIIYTNKIINIGTADSLIKYNDGYDLDFQEGNNVRVTFEAGGNVGIGENNPLTKLHIKKTDTGGTSTNYGTLLVEDTNTYLELLSTNEATWGSGINLIEASGSEANIDVWSLIRETTQDSESETKGNGNSKLHFKFGTNTEIPSNNNPTKLLIDKDGNVGIGTTIPDSKLDVTGGNITVNTDSTVFMDFKYGSANSETSRGTIKTDGVDLKINTTADLQLLPGGNVGIGTTSPSQELHVSGGVLIDGNITTPTAGTKGLLLDYYEGKSRYWSRGTDDQTRGSHYFYISDTDELVANNQQLTAMVISSSGNVGIGTETPQYALDFSTGKSIRLLGQDNGTVIRIGAGDGSNNVTLLRIDGSSTPIGNENYKGTSETGSLGFSIKYMGKNIQNDNSFSIFSDNQKSDVPIEALTILQDGNVGIKSNRPSHSLSVGGDVSASGDVITSRILVGTTSSHHSSADLQIVGSSSNYARIMLKDQDTTNANAFIDKSAQYLDFTSQNGESHGEIRFKTYDGTTTATRLRITPSGDIVTPNKISSSNHLYISTSDAGINQYLTVLINTASGRLYYTGSYGGGGGGSISTTNGNLTINGSVTSSKGLFFTSSGTYPKDYTIDYAKVYSSSINGGGETIIHSNILPESGSLNITASGVKIEGDLDADGNITLDGALSFNGFNFIETSTTVRTGSTIAGSGSVGADVQTTTHQFTGSVLITGSNLTLTNGTLGIPSYPNVATTLGTISSKEDSSNKSTDITTDATSDDKFPSVKAIKDYVDGVVSSIDGSDVDLTNVTTNILPDTTATYNIGSSDKKFNDLFAVNTFFGGVHEINLETEGLDQMQEGTVLSLKDGILQPCEKDSDSLVMGVVSKGRNYPIVLGAEPVLVTGKIKVGDYIITSKIKGHGKGVSPRHIYSKLLFGKVIAQAIEDGEGKSYTIKAMIRKM